MDNLAGKIDNCVVFAGDDLSPQMCSRFEYEVGVITHIQIEGPAPTPIGPLPVICPGLINGHTHVGDSFLPDAATGMTLPDAFFRPDGYKYRALAQLPGDEHVDRISDFLRGMAGSGVVGTFDFREQGLEGCRRLREASRRTGVEAIILSQLDESPFAADGLEENSAPLPDQALQELKALFAVSDGFSESTMNDLTDTAWKEVSKAAKAAKKGTAIHCLEDTDYRSTSMKRTGRGDLARAIELLQPDLIVHLTVADDDEIAALAASGIPAVLNPRANAVLGLPLPPLVPLLRAGVPLLLGTDNGMLNGPNLLTELDFAYRLARSQAGPNDPIAPVEILRMVTSNVSHTRWGSRFPGILVVGGPASFVEFDFSDPLLSQSQDICASLITRCQPADIRRTVFAGRTIHQLPA